MTVTKLFSEIDYIHRCMNIASSQGIQIQTGDNFEEFRELCDQHPSKGHVAPIFDPAVSDLPRTDGFWMVGRNKDGKLVHTQAIRTVNLVGVTMADHMRTHLHDYRPHGDHVDASRSMVSLTPQAACITGIVAYYGELWLMGGPNGYRGSCLTAIMPRLMFALALQAWNPDYFIGIMEPLAACKGLAAREGYMHVEQHSILWHQLKEPDPLEEWLVWMSRDEANFNLRMPPDQIARLYQPKLKSNLNVVEEQKLIA